MQKADKNQLKEMARQIRKDIVTMITEAGSGHPGGSLSGVEIAAALYFSEMRIDPQRPQWPERDRFILSKGHAAPLLYAVLAERGFFSRDELWHLRKLGSMLQGHPDLRKVPGVEMSTGSLGQGLAVANGMALAAKLDRKDYRVFVMLGDGETQEGMVCEAAMAAAHYKLDNVVAFLDHNGFQIDGAITKVLSPEPVVDKWKAFGWNVLTIDGHNFDEIINALAEAENTKGKPTMVVAETVKGKGVSFMENEPGWHGAAPKPEELERALKDLEGGPA